MDRKFQKGDHSYIIIYHSYITHISVNGPNISKRPTKIFCQILHKGDHSRPPALFNIKFRLDSGVFAKWAINGQNYRIYVADNLYYKLT